MIEICKACGRRKAGRFVKVGSRGPQSWRLCDEPAHEGVIQVTEAQAAGLTEAAKAYNASREIEDRARALSDWLAVLAGETQPPAAEQMELA